MAVASCTTGSDYLKRSHSLNPHHKKQSPTTSPSPGHLPLHLQDPHYSRFRRRRPSTLSTHSHDMNSPINSPISAHTFSRSHFNGYFVFPSPTSPSKGAWLTSPNGEQPFNQWHYSIPTCISPSQQSCSSYSMDYLSKPSCTPTIKVRPPSFQNRRKSVDCADLQTHRTASNELTNFQSLNLLDAPTTNKCGSIRVKKFYDGGETSPVVPITPTGHTPSMRLSFDTLEKESKCNSARSGRRRPYQVVYPNVPIRHSTVLDRHRARIPACHRKQNGNVDFSPSSLNSSRPKRSSVGACRSLDFTDGVNYHIPNGYSFHCDNWYDSSPTSLSGVSTSAVVYHHCNKRACDYIKPIHIKPYQSRRKLFIVVN